MYKNTAIVKQTKKKHALRCQNFHWGLRACMAGCLEHSATSRDSMGSVSLSHLPDKSRSTVRDWRSGGRGNYGTREKWTLEFHAQAARYKSSNRAAPRGRAVRPRLLEVEVCERIKESRMTKKPISNRCCSILLPSLSLTCSFWVQPTPAASEVSGPFMVCDKYTVT